ncbi:organelle RRM domain-containing protein 6, chloroplastic-like [Oryza brachyantha]|uniref:organelle RRM domain-containing protein 6, chloroplastic-like n=1 Tax=Oryza brachyantha TaxID=4533 RepID=UPI0007763375|nr:organelle RRM domain-containing protein 6, chloroplastic-like [Oryza brachyantha]XP_015692056.1 organelle RRM domain-containing protein 6, chloroplastic-like [Oryza brachyantha]
MARARAAVIPVAAPSRTFSVSLAAYPSSPSSSHPSRPVASSGVSCSQRRLPAAAARSHPPPSASSRLYVSGLSFRTTEESLRNAFERFGQLTEVNLVMDRVAKRPRGFAFLSYTSEEESKNAMEGMHGKFLDGRVIFVEFAKQRSDV